jgi:hypothetical protein
METTERLRCDCHDCTQARIPRLGIAELERLRVITLGPEETVLAERERCAKIAEGAEMPPVTSSWEDVRCHFAAKIREGK